MSKPTIQEEYAAFDRLPPKIRAIMAFGPFSFRATDVLEAIQGGHDVGALPRTIRATWNKQLAAGDLRWRKAGHGPYPHTAARATLMIAEPIDEAAPAEVRMKFYHRRQRKRLRDPASFTARPQQRAPDGIAA